MVGGEIWRKRAYWMNDGGGFGERSKRGPGILSTRSGKMDGHVMAVHAWIGDADCECSGVIVARSGKKTKGPELEGEGKWGLCRR